MHECRPVTRPSGHSDTTTVLYRGTHRRHISLYSGRIIIAARVIKMYISHVSASAQVRLASTARTTAYLMVSKHAVSSSTASSSAKPSSRSSMGTKHFNCDAAWVARVKTVAQPYNPQTTTLRVGCGAARAFATVLSSAAARLNVKVLCGSPKRRSAEMRSRYRSWVFWTQAVTS